MVVSRCFSSVQFCWLDFLCCPKLSIHPSSVTSAVCGDFQPTLCWRRSKCVRRSKLQVTLINHHKSHCFPSSFMSRSMMVVVVGFYISDVSFLRRHLVTDTPWLRDADTRTYSRFSIFGIFSAFQSFLLLLIFCTAMPYLIACIFTRILGVALQSNSSSYSGFTTSTTSYNCSEINSKLAQSLPPPHKGHFTLLSE